MDGRKSLFSLVSLTFGSKFFEIASVLSFIFLVLISEAGVS